MNISTHLNPSPTRSVQPAADAGLPPPADPPALPLAPALAPAPALASEDFAPEDASFHFGPSGPAAAARPPQLARRPGPPAEAARLDDVEPLPDVLLRPMRPPPRRPAAAPPAFMFRMVGTRKRILKIQASLTAHWHDIGKEEFYEYKPLSQQTGTN